MDAIDDLGDAVDATRRLLTPIRVGTWAKLAVVVVFVGSLGFGLGAAAPGDDVVLLTDDPTIGGGQVEDVQREAPTDDLAAIALALAGLFGFLWLCYALVAGVMEFVFLESLRSGEVRLRRYFAANLGNGVRLFLFRLGLLLVAGALGGGPAFLLAAGDGSITDLSPGLVGLYSLYGLAVVGGYSVVRRFTDAFVAPIVLLEDRSVLGAWARFRRTLRADWTEYAVYLLLAWFLTLAVAIAAWTVVGVGLLLLAIPVGIVWFALLLLGPIGLALLLVIGPLSIAVALWFVGLVWTPIETFFQYYALLLLGDTDEELDLIPDRRAAIRTAGGAGFGRGAEWTEDDRGPTRNPGRGPLDGDGSRRASNPRPDADPWDDSSSADLWAETDGETDPWEDADDDADPWTETDDISDVGPWDEASGSNSVDPWDEADDSESVDPWDTGADDTDSRDEIDDAGNERDDDIDGADDDRTW